MAYTLTNAIAEATRAGFKLHQDEDGLWWITTPKAPRRPEQELGSYKNSDRAWMAAASLARDEGGRANG